MVSLVVNNGPSVAHVDQRRSLLAKVHIARKSLGIVEDDYRALLHRVAGHRSAKDCDNRQLGKMLVEFERMGFESTSRTARRSPATSAVARKARAIWISLYQLGAIGDGSDAALDAFGRRQLRVDRLQWADESQGFKLIEALKSIAERNGWDHAVSTRLPGSERVRILKCRLIDAQIARLADVGEVTSWADVDRAGWPAKRLEYAAAELAIRIRELPAPT